MTKIHKYKITEQDRLDLMEVLDGAYKLNHSDSYWDKVVMFRELFKEDTFDESTVGDESENSTS